MKGSVNSTRNLIICYKTLKHIYLISMPLYDILDCKTLLQKTSCFYHLTYTRSEHSEREKRYEDLFELFTNR